MFKIIGADGQQYGPVSAEQLRQWVAEGRANVQTLIQAESSADWVQVLTEDEMGRTSLALAPSNQNILYALSSSLNPAREDALHAVFRSNSSGDPGSWTAQRRYSFVRASGHSRSGRKPISAKSPHVSHCNRVRPTHTWRGQNSSLKQVPQVEVQCPAEHLS